MQGACDEFLPGAALAINEYAAVGGSGDGNLLAQGFHGDAVADDLEALAELAAQYQVLLLKAALLDGIADEDDDFFEGERLFDEVEGAKFRGAHGGFDVAMAGDHDDRGRIGNVADAAEGFHAVDAWQPDIQKNDVQVAGGDAVQSFFGGAHGFHGVMFVAQDGGERFADARLIVHDQDFVRRAHESLSIPERSAGAAVESSATGSSIKKREPTGRLSSTRREPPCSEMMRGNSGTLKAYSSCARQWPGPSQCRVPWWKNAAGRACPCPAGRCRGPCRKPQFQWYRNPSANGWRR